MWSALVHGNNILTVGYGSENEIFSENRSQSLINKKDELVSLISKNEKISKDKLTIVEHLFVQTPYELAVLFERVYEQSL